MEEEIRESSEEGSSSEEMSYDDYAKLPEEEHEKLVNETEQMEQIDRLDNQLKEIESTIEDKPDEPEETEESDEVAEDKPEVKSEDDIGDVQLIQSQTPYKSIPDLVKGFKNAQSEGTRNFQENAELRKRIEALETKPEEPISEEEEEEFVDRKTLREEYQKMKESDRAEYEARETEKDILRQEREATSLPDWQENKQKVFDILSEFDRTNMPYANTSNTFKFGLELAKEPELKDLYMENPNLVLLENGGLTQAREILQARSLSKKLEDAKEQGKKEGTMRQVKHSKSLVATSSGKATVENGKSLNKMSLEEQARALPKVAGSSAEDFI